MRTTVVVHDRHASRVVRTKAAVEGRHGVQVLAVELLASRLAGGFWRPIDPDDLKSGIGDALATPLGQLDRIKELPGFQRAAAATLAKAWSAGLALADEAAEATDPKSRARLASLAALERETLARLPKNQLRPTELVAAALTRVHHGRALFGRVEIHGRTEMSPVWVPLLEALAKHTDVVWVAEARSVPAWLAGTGVTVERREAERPSVRAVSCASPKHEILEALRWVRRLLVQGVPHHQIAVAAASPEPWDDHVTALADAAGLPVHFAHGRPVLATPAGQAAAALAEILLRGFSRPRVVRLAALLRRQAKRFEALKGNWWRELPEAAPLLDARSWRKAIADLTDSAVLVGDLVEAIAQGIGEAEGIGEALLAPPALAVWRRALADGPASAIDVTLRNLRMDDGLEPEASVLWARSATLAASPRPHVWLVGLTSRSWPRKAGEDPLLPDHVIPSARLEPLPVHQADRRDFRTILATTAREVVCSRARRDAEGRVIGASPLLPRGIREEHLAWSREPEHAASAADRLFARPAEFSRTPVAASAHAAWTDWHRQTLTKHDGLIRPRHPTLIAALDRRQSASSLSKLLRDPLGYLWSYGFGWSAPEETDEPLTLEAMAFGNLLHEILDAAVTDLERRGKGGFANAGAKAIQAAVGRADAEVSARWEDFRPIPPPVVWRRKRREAVELACVALTYPEAPLAGQRSWAEVPFGGDRRAGELSEAERSALPWDPMREVTVPGTDVRIGGAIDRLDLSGDRAHARVTDYKSGKPRKPPQLNGGAELQRCLYAYAVKALVGGRPDVDARLLYSRKDGQLLALDDPDATLDKLAGYLRAANSSFLDGKTLSGPAALTDWYDFAFALPGGARESHLAMKLPLAADALKDVAPLWQEP